MRRINAGSMGDILVPEGPAETSALINLLDDKGVGNSISMLKDGLNFRLNLAQQPAWDDDGVVCATITLHSGEELPVYFWIIAWGDEAGQRAVYWSRQHAIASAKSW